MNASLLSSLHTFSAYMEILNVLQSGRVCKRVRTRERERERETVWRGWYLSETSMKCFATSEWADLRNLTIMWWLNLPFYARVCVCVHTYVFFKVRACFAVCLYIAPPSCPQHLRGFQPSLSTQLHSKDLAARRNERHLFTLISHWL